MTKEIKKRILRSWRVKFWYYLFAPRYFIVRLSLRLKEWAKRHWHLYEVSELAIGGHCGCCGKWVDKAIVEKGWEWTLCNECAKGWYEKGPTEED